jgi:hypothetical protein
MTQVFLAYSISGESKKTLAYLGPRVAEINMLVSFVYLPHYRKRKQELGFPRPKRTILDSGAFSAWTRT